MRVRPGIRQPLSLKIAAALFMAFVLSAGCFLPVPGFREHGTQSQTAKKRRQPNTATAKRTHKKHGVYHTVQRGETIYRISRLYKVPQEKIIRANNIKDVTKIKVGQVLFIPGAWRVRTDPASVAYPAGSTNRIRRNGTHRPPSYKPAGRTPPPPPVKARCPPGAIKFIWPAQGKITSGFGIRNGRQHDGIDIANKIGTPLLAAADGVVIYSGRLGGYGLIVILKHEGNFKTIYAHNRRNLVKKGDTVRQGQKVAELGNSGNATGPHLHFEIRCGQQAVDPIPYLPKRQGA